MKIFLKEIYDKKVIINDESSHFGGVQIINCQKIMVDIILRQLKL